MPHENKFPGRAHAKNKLSVMQVDQVFFFFIFYFFFGIFFFQFFFFQFFFLDQSQKSS